MAKLPDSEVSELIKIADAEVKEIIRKGRWYSLGIPVKTKIYYNLKEQLEAIEKLCNSENEKALEYIKSLFYSEDIPGYEDYSLRPERYPNIKGELNKALSHGISTNYLRELYDRVPSPFIDNREVCISYKIKSARSKLENSLSNK